jgi:negative regulator of sigma E activity
MARRAEDSLVSIALLVSLAATLTSPAAPGLQSVHAATAPAPLSQAVRARSTVAYQGEQIVMTWEGTTHTVASLVRVEYDPPSWTRLDYMALGPSRRLTLIRRATSETRFDPVRLTGTTTMGLSYDEDTFQTAHLPWLLENYGITTSPDELLGRKATLIELVPTVPDRPTRRLVVDDATGVVLRSERIGPKGSLGEVTTFLRFEVMPVGWRKNATVPSGLRLTPQPAVQMATAAEVAGALAGPPVEVVVPEGFHKTGDYVTGEIPPVVQTVYSDGLSTLVVYQRRGTVARPPEGSTLVRTASGPIWVQRLGLRTLVHWTHAGRILTMVGYVTRTSLQAAAERTGIARAPRIWDRLVTWLQEMIHSF